jgi:CHAT domain-containing protein
MQRGGRTAIVVLSALVGAAGLAWLSSGWSPVTRNALADLAAAVGSDLPFEARPSGGFAPPLRHALRSSETPGVPLSPDARIAIAELEKRAAADQRPDVLAAVGVAYLVNGDVDRAISTLEDVAQTLKSARPWNDLSAAYLAKAQRVPQRRIEYLSRALEAAATSMRLGPSDEARFNRALALDGVARFVGQPAPWAEYMGAERDPRWVEAAKRYMAKDRPTEDARDRWEARQRELGTRLATQDRAFVAETAKLFPEGSTEVFGQRIIAWAKATLANDVGAARSAALEAGLIADAVGSVTGDRMLTEEMAVVRRGSPLLAQAHLDYAEGVRAYNSVDYQTAQNKLLRARAAYAKTHSTYVGWADAMLATILFYQRDLIGADRQLAILEQSARARHYETLLGRTLWLRGLVYTKDWRLTEAFAAFRAAASCFERAGQHEFAVSIYSLLADTLRTLGEHHESWENIGKTLEGLERVRIPQRRYLLLYNATLFASNQDLLEAALLFQHATVREASKAAAGIAVDALTQRAVIYQRRGDRANAEGDLAEAAKRLEDVREGQTKAHLRAEIDVLRAQLDHAGAADAAEGRISSAIEFFRKAEPARVPRLYLDLARMRLQDRSSNADEALAEGIATLEKQQLGLSDEALKISYFDESWNLFQEMVALQHARADSNKAFEYAERSRARSLLAAASGQGARSLRDIQNVLPPSVAMVYYATLSDRLLIWVMTSAGDRLVESSIQQIDLIRLVARQRSAIAEKRDDAAVNNRLHDVLIRPVAGNLAGHSTIVFVPDGNLQQLPFAALRDSVTRRYLIEDYAVLMTPSASFYAAARAQWQANRSGMSSALLVGNPSAAAPALPGAEAEVNEVAKYYPRHSVLTGVNATKERFVQSAPEYDVVHFGGHAFTNAEYPLLSRLSFSAEGEDRERPLFAYEISRLRFSRTQVVVLAACSTAVGTVSRGEGAISVARPFLGAGVPVVVASQWDVDDVATQQLFLDFHRALSSTKDPVTALRSAQLALLGSGTPALVAPASWAAFVALGTTAQ